ncbi:hypothetical protein [Micromonospora sp. CB01531]|uniref:hypothetical protein n=1 Tax=Micromonospora sp. CB01531 TaxID=1718947 RepID=UPI00093F5B04|nr:hypothetical protein [Micromonospora sp. CB01531]OKI61665.1 hypothetical protein A6A27_27720 [Micromonospora sp. CB01531]
MGLADFIRIARGNLTAEELAERDALARERSEARRAEAERARVEAEQALQRRRAQIAARDRHPERMEVAVGISSIELVCHADTLTALLVMLQDTSGWTSPRAQEGRIEALDGNMVRVHLSGHQVSLILFRTAERAQNAWQGQAVVAKRLYRAFAGIIDQVDPDAPSAEPIPPVVLDDRVGVRRGEDDEMAEPGQS